MTTTTNLIERLWASDAANELTNEAARALEAQGKQIEHWKTARESAMFAGEQMLEKLKEQAKQIEKTKQYAVRFAPDYPGIEKAEPWEQLYALVTTLEGTLAANDDLHKKIEALQADAKRYRWLRDVGDASFMALGKRPNVRFTHEIDAAIDLARKGTV
jgi:hypothetical protein